MSESSTPETDPTLDELLYEQCEQLLTSARLSLEEKQALSRRILAIVLGDKE